MLLIISSKAVYRSFIAEPTNNLKFHFLNIPWLQVCRVENSWLVLTERDIEPLLQPKIPSQIICPVGVILTFCCCISVSNQTLFALLQISIKIECRWGICLCQSVLHVPGSCLSSPRSRLSVSVLCKNADWKQTWKMNLNWIIYPNFPFVKLRDSKLNPWLIYKNGTFLILVDSRKFCCITEFSMIVLSLTKLRWTNG